MNGLNVMQALAGLLMGVLYAVWILIQTMIVLFCLWVLAALFSIFFLLYLATRPGIEAE